MAPRPLHPADAAARQRAVIVRLFRMAFVALIATVTLIYTLEYSEVKGRNELQFSLLWWLPLAVTTVGATAVLLVDVLTPRKRIATYAGVFFGILLGLVAAAAFSFIIDLFMQTYEITGNTPQAKAFFAVKLIIGICLCYLAVTTVLQTQDDFRLVIPYVEFAKQIRGPRPLLLDTSALIDARIVDLVATGFIQVPVVIPAFVVAECQALGDSADRLKRARGKRGLETITRLQRTAGLDLSIDETPVPGKAVDLMLVELARTMPATIITTDAGLGRVATIQGVSTLNLNELSNALKPSLIPGSRVNIHLVKAGEQPHQGVGYLDDGTMVIVEQAAAFVGSEVTAEVTSSLQTSAGRLIFTKLTDQPGQLASATPLALAEGAVVAESPAADADDDAPTTHTPAPSTPSVPLISPPLTIAPPAPPPPSKPGPFPPHRSQRNPQRNPRR